MNTETDTSIEVQSWDKSVDISKMWRKHAPLDQKDANGINCVHFVRS